MRILMAMVLLFSHATAWRIAIGVGESTPSRVQIHQMDEGAYGCPLCELAEYFDGYVPQCDCGCTVSESPMPETPTSGVAVVPSLDRYEPIEIEITRIVAMGTLESGSSNPSALRGEHVALDKDVHQFLAKTGHWIL